MAKQANIQGAIDKLRSSNEKTLGEISDRSGEIAFNTRTTKNLIGDMLDGMALDRQRSQDKEEKPVAKKEDAPKGPDSSKDGGLAGGIGGILAGIAGAALGFVSGFVSAFTRPLSRALVKFTKAMKVSKLGVFLTNWGKSAVTSIKNFFTPLTKLLGNMRLDFRNALKGNANAAKGFSSFVGSIVNGINNFFSGVGKVFTKLGIHPTQLKRRINAVRKSLGILSNSIKGTTGFFSKIGERFKKIGDGVKKAGKVTQALSKTFQTFFRVFSTIGRVIAFPITVITGIIGGIRGMFKDFTKARQEGDGILKSAAKGLLGFVKGAVNAIVMMPLDLLKKGVGFIAGKLGFKNFENLLAGFSFAGLFSGLVDGVFNGLTAVVDGFVEIAHSALVGAIEGFQEFGLVGAISGFLGSIATSIKNIFFSLIEKVFGMFEGGDDMFAALSEGIANIKQKIKDFFVGLLPEQGSFMSKFVPDSVYEWAGLPASAEPEPSELPTEEAVPQRGMFEEKVNEAGLAFKADMDKRNAEFEAEYARQQAEMNAIRMDALKSGDTTQLEKKKEELKPVKSFEERETEKLAKMKEDLKLAEEGKLKLGWTWTDAEIAAEKDEIVKQSMIDDNSAEAQVREREKLKEDIARKEKELSDFKLKKEQREADIQKFGSEEAGKLSRMSEAEREKNLTRAREMIAKSERGEEVLAINKRRAEALLAAESQRQQAMIVAPSTNVVNNNSSQGIVMNQNMPAVDPLDQAYGV